MRISSYLKVRTQILLALHGIPHHQEECLLHSRCYWIRPLVKLPGKHTEMEIVAQISWCSCDGMAAGGGRERSRVGQGEKASLSAVAVEGLTSCDLVGRPAEG